MPKRIDIDGGDGENEIAEALRQLGRRQQSRGREAELERAVQELAEQQKAAGPPPPPTDRGAGTPPSPGRKPAGAWGARLAWVGIAVVVIGLIVAVAVFMRPPPPPPLAATPEAAVRDFWSCLIAGKYEAATHYYPAMQTQYGSASQAAERLKEVFQSDPPAVIRTIGEAETVPDSTSLRVHYEIYKKSGQPRVGDFLVTGSEGTGYVIFTGGV